MTYRTMLLALLAPCLLVACTNETTIPEATDTSRRTAAATPQPVVPPVTAFDGRYAGRFTLNPDRSRACPASPDQELGVIVRQGRATLLIDPANQHVLVGTVGPAGDVRMSDSLDRTIATSGIFENGRFIGEHRVGVCTYSVRMTKRE